jgi:hypothetical protein
METTLDVLKYESTPVMHQRKKEMHSYMNASIYSGIMTPKEIHI